LVLTLIFDLVLPGGAEETEGEGVDTAAELQFVGEASFAERAVRSCHLERNQIAKPRAVSNSTAPAWCADQPINNPARRRAILDFIQVTRESEQYGWAQLPGRHEDDPSGFASFGVKTV
jgi:hypothetical protein